ncbi:putative complex I intermediate-associated protein 30 [Phytophthora ramorum]|uniref:putative complex I intermediate-associated protein 30 n=1 Tax=Phytophthora ramorum TaxID=164328 RepID=UPI0030A09FBA|nr:putative complex I intermediate-associated protein 30 [Phytophthora ramorum]
MGLWRKALTSMNATLLSSKQSLGLQLKLQPQKDIFLFNAKDSVANWTASSDRSIGGLSECKWGFYKSGEQEEQEEEEENASKRLIHKVNNQDNVPSAVFTGRLSMDCQPTEVGVVRSGYCAVRASVPPELLLHGYEGLTMRVMTDGRDYRMNVQMESWNPFNLYMGFIRTPPNEWVDIDLPFRDFLLTAKGFVKLDDETELDPSKLKSVGFAIADQKEGDFELRIQWIKAVAQLGPSDKDNYNDDDDRFDNSSNSKDYFRKPADLVI